MQLKHSCRSYSKDMTLPGKCIYSIILIHYHGEIALSLKGKYIWGSLGLNNEKIRIEYLSQIEKKLRTTKKVVEDHLCSLPFGGMLPVN